MLIRIGYDLIFEVPQPTPMQLMLYVHPDQAPALRQPERIVVEPADRGGGLRRLVRQPGGAHPGAGRPPADPLRQRHRGQRAPDAPIEGLRLTPVHEMPPECWRYLFASRYCEVDRMSHVAWDLFGKTPESWERVQAVLDWVHANVTFGYQFARPTKTAFDVYTERQGVCRDFQHLAITFLRALNIPARYATGYLGDIGVPAGPDADGLLGVGRGVRGRRLAHHRRPPQPAAHRPGADGARPRRRRRRAHDLLRRRRTSRSSASGPTRCRSDYFAGGAGEQGGHRAKQSGAGRGGRTQRELVGGPGAGAGSCASWTWRESRPSTSSATTPTIPPIATTRRTR